MTAAGGSTRRRATALDVTVVGGGMAGAATALALAQAGFATALLERREPAPWSAGGELDLRVVGLAPSSIALLSELGVWTSIRAARCGTYTRMHVWDACSGAALDFAAADTGHEALGCIVENALVQRTLWDALPAAGVRVLCPVQVEGMRLREHDIELQLADRDAVHSRLLVAADGGGSRLRQWAGIDTRGRDYAQTAVVAHVGTTRAHQDTAWQRFLPGGPLALLPLADGRSSIVWSLPRDEAQRVLALGDDAFMQALGAASDFRLGPITTTTSRAGFPLKLQLAKSYQAPRLVLLGDAAHSVHPLAGQGVNLGLRDVAQLRETLLAARAAGRDLGAAPVLRRYARRRRSADTLDGLGFDALQRMYAWRLPPLVGARAVGIKVLNHLPGLRHALARHAAGV